MAFKGIVGTNKYIGCSEKPPGSKEWVNEMHWWDVTDWLLLWPKWLGLICQSPGRRLNAVHHVVGNIISIVLWMWSPHSSRQDDGIHDVIATTHVYHTYYPFWACRLIKAFSYAQNAVALARWSACYTFTISRQDTLRLGTYKSVP